MMVVEIQCVDAQGSHDAEKRLIGWLTEYGHTSTNHDFAFFKVGRIAGKAMKGLIQTPPAAAADQQQEDEE